MPPLTAPLPADQPLTDRLLRSWLRCRRRAWLDRFGVAGERRWNAHRALALSDQLRSFQTLLANRPGHGEAACAAGAPGVVGLRLRGHDPQGRRLEAHPALLERMLRVLLVKVNSAKPPQLAGVLVGLARLGYRPHRLGRRQAVCWCMWCGCGVHVVRWCMCSRPPCSARRPPASGSLPSSMPPACH